LETNFEPLNVLYFRTEGVCIIAPEHIDNPLAELEAEIAAVLEEDPDRDLLTGEAEKTTPTRTEYARVALHVDAEEHLEQAIVKRSPSLKMEAPSTSTSTQPGATQTAAKLLLLLSDDLAIKAAMEDQLKSFEGFTRVSCLSIRNICYSPE
jgi:hypothetical protein